MNSRYIVYSSADYNEKQRCFDFLKAEYETDKRPSRVNMWRDDWQNHKETLPYILEKTDRFSKNGEFIFYEVDNRIIACSGVYQSMFCESIYLAGVRMWVTQDYRNQTIPRNILLTKNKEFAVHQRAKIVALSFNEYNKNLIAAIKRNRLGEKINRQLTRTPEFMFHNGIEELEFPVVIQYTPQWVIYESLDSTFTYDWTSIRYES